MKKIITLLSIILGILSSFSHSYASSYIYDEKNGMIYLGGYPIEILRYELDKLNDLYLKRQIHALNIKGDTGTLLKTENPISAYEISNKRYIAVSTSEADEKKCVYKQELSIFNENGEQIANIEDVIIEGKIKYFSWSKDGSKIAYITGKSIIEAREPFEPKGVWIYDVENNNSIKVADKGVKVNWSRHDNNIYIENEFGDPTDISVYNTSSGKLTKSDRRGIVFSDDGRYYIGKELIKDVYPVSMFYIYDNIKNKKIYKFTGKEGFRFQEALNYCFIRNTHFILIINLWGYNIFDADSKKLVKSSKKRIVGLNKDMTKAVVYEGGGKLVHIDLLLSGTRITSIKIPEK